MIRRQREHRRKGAILILVVLCLPVILAFCVFALNVAWMQLTRTELRTATDAAARAGSRMLSQTNDPAQARTAAHSAAGRNNVGGTALLLDEADISFGYAEPDASGSWILSPRLDTDKDLTSIRVLGRRTADSPSGPVPLLFTGLFDRTTFEPVKAATATFMDRDIVLVLDRSGSMNSATPTGTRWTDLSQAVFAFVNALQSTPQTELVGLVTYSSNASSDLGSVSDLHSDYGSCLQYSSDRQHGHR
ncbi:MAG: vWA domain-containing protein [Planctomycetaceae bacterium]